MSTYYNDYDPRAAATLRQLIAEGLIAPGDVDYRSIVDVQPKDLTGYVQCHFFAGIGGWSRAARLAGWPDDRPIWTGSCPCQPFSVAGKGQGEKDPRHLWPEFYRLIRECHPPVVFGEQVASKAGRLWLAGVRTDLEDMGYAVGAADLCAAGVGAPHIRQRLYWLADAEHAKRGKVYRPIENERDGKNTGRPQTYGEPGARREVCATGGLADAEGSRPSSVRETYERQSGPSGIASCGATGGLEHAELCRCEVGQQERQGTDATLPSSPWRDYDIIHFADGKARRIERGTLPLAYGLPAGLVYSDDPGAPIDASATAEARVMRLRGYGNAIVPALAALFMRAFEERSGR